MDSRQKNSPDSKEKNLTQNHFFYRVSPRLLMYQASFLNGRDFINFFSSSSSLNKFMKQTPAAHQLRIKHEDQFMLNQFGKVSLDYSPSSYGDERVMCIHIKKPNSKDTESFEWRRGWGTFAPFTPFDHLAGSDLEEDFDEKRAMQFVKDLGDGAHLEHFIQSDSFRSFFIMTNRGIFAGGDNAKGQLGTGGQACYEDKICGIKALDEIPIRDIVGVDDATFFIGNKCIYACGNNENKQLVFQTNQTTQPVPLEIKALSGIQVRKIFSIEEKRENTFAQTNGIIFFDTDHGLMVAGRGELDVRELDEKSIKNLNLPAGVEVKDIKVSFQASSYTFVKRQDCDGYRYSIYVITDQGVFSYGKNDHGQLGTNDKLNRNIPQKITVPENVHVLDVVAEPTCAFFLALVDKKEFRIFGCGKNETFNIESAVPVMIPCLSLSLDRISKEEQSVAPLLDKIADKKEDSRRCVVM